MFLDPGFATTPPVAVQPVVKLAGTLEPVTLTVRGGVQEIGLGDSVKLNGIESETVRFLLIESTQPFNVIISFILLCPADGNT